MERITKFCCGRCDTAAEELDLVQSSTQLSVLPSESSLQPLSEQHPETPSEICISDEPNFRMLQVKKHNNAFTIEAARFSPDSITHKVVISFNEGGTKMNLNIEGERLLKIDVKTQFQGNFKFSIDAMLVEFMWDISRMPMSFTFHRRVGASGSRGNYDNKSNDSGGGHDGDSSNSGDDRKLKWPNEQWDKCEEGYSLHIFGV